MPIDSVVVGSGLVRQVTVQGDPTQQSYTQNVGPFTGSDAQSLAGLFSALVGSVELLDNPVTGNFDRRRSAPGATGVALVVTESIKATYAAASVGITLAATATDFFQLVGSGSKTVRVTQVQVSGLATAAATNDVLLIKRTAANTGGTATQPTPVVYDGNDAAASAVANLYSANPTTGGTSSGGGTLRAGKLNLGAAGAAGVLTWDFTTRNSKGLVLRGVAQSLCLNWNGNVVPSGTLLDVSIEWTEES